MLNVTDANFSDVLAAPQAAVYFWSPTCGYCKAFTPIFESLSVRYSDRILMVGANVLEAQKAAGSYGLTGVPTVVFLKNGQVVGKEVTGGMSEPEFAALLEASLGGAPAAAAAGGGASDYTDQTSWWPFVVLAALGVGAYYGLDLNERL